MVSLAWKVDENPCPGRLAAMKRLVPAVVLLLGACTPAATDLTPTATVPPTSQTTTTTATTEPVDAPDCLAGDLPFAESGIAAALDSPQHDAITIGGIRWQPEQACERIMIEFLAEGGSPATRLGPVGVTVAQGSRVVRVSLPEAVAASAIGDSLLNGSLVHHVYVVEGIEDGLVVDLHLAQPAAARAFTTTSPSRLIIDLRPIADGAATAPQNATADVVLSSPRPGPELYPLRVAGYARPGVGAVQVTLRDQLGVVALSRSVSTVSSQHVWRAFTMTISDGPSGSVTVEVTADTGGDPVTVELDLP